MKKSFFAICAAATVMAAPVQAQNQEEVEAPDGSPAFGIEPYVAVMGVINDFDSEEHDSGIPNSFGGDGRMIEGLVGVNVPIGAFFVGAEGSVAKGIDGDIDWEYGAAGRAGVRIGDSGMFYGKVGYQWVNFDAFGNDSPDYDDIQFGIGAEIGPEEIGLAGITGEAGIRLRMEVQTFGDFESLRPAVGVVAHF